MHATKFKIEEAIRLSDLSRLYGTIPYDPHNYMAEYTSVKLVTTMLWSETLF